MQTTYGQPAAESSHDLRARAPRSTALASDRPAPRGGAQPAGHESLLAAMVDSRVYREYEQAFTEATGMPMALRPVESWQLPLHGKRHEAPFCALMSQHSRACASCLQMQEGLSRAASMEPHSAVCPSGLCETAVPVHLGEQLIGFLQTGQVFRRTPTQAQFERVARKAAQSGIAVDKAQMKAAYFATRVVPQKQFESATILLKIFAQYLSILSNQVVVQRENAEPPVITRAKKYIEEHQTEELRLAEVAKAVNSSTFYFCKMFKKTTGINFTDYVSRVRVEKSKNLLLNPNLRISEIAYEVGFQSLTHFNRVFKRVVGNSPTEYREHLMATQAG
jgi:AraC-like DNA-binding protein/ligand-binding sensor protein